MRRGLPTATEVQARYVFDFQEGSMEQSDLLGGKGAGLAEMTRLGLPVPSGFTITTEACRYHLERGEIPPDLWDDVRDAIARLEERTGRRLGGVGGPPLLLSVRSGAKYSMPGMMDTVLDLGVGDDVVAELVRWSGDERFAWDVHRRFVQTFGKVVRGVSAEEFEAVLTALREQRGAGDDAGLTAEDLETATRRFQEIVARSGGRPLPADPMEQLREATEAVFRSWTNRRAREYRRLHGIAEDLGTAVNVQMMVFGDLGDTSGTGVCFTRDPATGEAVPYGDYLPDAQGEDVVAGVRNTVSLGRFGELLPDVQRQLLDVLSVLEKHYRDMCDVEFTVERGTLWILQTRVGKRTAQAAVRMAVEMADEGLITRQEAVLRVDPASLDLLFHPRLAPGQDELPRLAAGVAASPGAACGRAVFDSDRAVEWAGTGEEVVLVRWETTPDDIHGMAAAGGILTSHGGKTSHAAVVARGMGKPAVTGAVALMVDEHERRFRVDGLVVREGDVITVDGTSGTVFLGRAELIAPTATAELDRLAGWADEWRTLGVRANADTGAGARMAKERGAEGIGLARTEHMFLGDRLGVVRRIILAEGEERDRALARLGELQTADFEDLLAAMDGLPVVIRLLDPPLHEFLPDPLHLERRRSELIAVGSGTEDTDAMIEAVSRWTETNPMLGLRGVRLGIVMPELYRMQVRAALAATARRLGAGGDPRLEIMVPLVSTLRELHAVRTMVEEEIALFPWPCTAPHIRIGTMIELPRAALVARELAADAEFFSVGSNDLTQTTFGLSRDDAEGSFLGRYLAEGIFASNPFATLDPEGVGRLIEIAVREGRAGRGDLEIGLCGEHGGDPASISLCSRLGLDYVSCSPFRVPVARLAAAHAALAPHGSRHIDAAA